MSTPLNWLGQRMVGLQGPDRPWTILFGIRLRTPVPAAAVAAAWRHVSEARPEVAVVLGSDFRWEAADPLDPVTGPVEPYLDHAMRPGRDQPVTVVLEADPSPTIRFVVNHAHADGMGVRGMADDLLRALAGFAVEPRPAMADEHLGRLVRRPSLRAGRRQIPPRGIATITAPSTAPTTLDIVSIDRGPVDERRRSTGVSVSALLVEATHRALTDFPAVGPGRIALGVPADLRRHAGGPSGIGNGVVNLTFAPRTSGPPTLGDVDHFLRDEAAVERLGETLAWIRLVGRPQMPRTTPRSGRAVATAMLSNLGLVGAEPHWDPVETLELVAPAHQTTSVGFIGYRDTLTVTVRSRGAAAGLATRIASALDG